jgi:aminopeptidase
LSDPRLAKWAQVIAEYSVEIRPGDQAFITTTPAATPLVLELTREILQRGAYPQFLVSLPGVAEVFMRYASEEQLKIEQPLYKKVVEEFDVRIAISADTNTRALSTIDPDRMSSFAAGQRALTDTFMRRQAAGELRWCVTLYPTEAYAQDAEMSLREYEEFVMSACLLNEPDPVASWKAVSARQQRLVDWLKGKKRVRVNGPNCELQVGIDGRTFINADGKRNFPDGEIFTGPEETVTEGWVKFTYPAIYQGREVEGVELEFKAGRVVKAGARKGEGFLVKMLDTDPGARVLGEFAIGTNDSIQRFTRQILFDEKIGGSIHMAVGSGYPDTGSTNKSAVHWDLICDTRDGTEIAVDGIPFYRSGEFLVK